MKNEITLQVSKELELINEKEDKLAKCLVLSNEG